MSTTSHDSLSDILRLIRARADVIQHVDTTEVCPLQLPFCLVSPHPIVVAPHVRHPVRPHLVSQGFFKGDALSRHPKIGSHSLSDTPAAAALLVSTDLTRPRAHRASRKLQGIRLQGTTCCTGSRLAACAHTSCILAPSCHLMDVLLLVEMW